MTKPQKTYWQNARRNAKCT